MVTTSHVGLIMIGQKELLNKFYELAKNKQLPRFILLTGEEGSGKHLVVNSIKDYTGFDLVEVGTKVDDIRNMINDAYSNQEPTIYAIYDADTMNEAAKNAMLKLCEEPTNSAYIIMTLTNRTNTLETILSRAIEYKMSTYTKEELLDYYHSLGKSELEDFVTSICKTPGQIKKLVTIGVKEFYDFVDLVFNNVEKVSGSNSFKIGNNLALNNEDNKYPLDLFFKAFINMCASQADKEINKFYYGVLITSQYLRELRYASLNKTMLFDTWLLDIRARWMEYAENN